MTDIVVIGAGVIGSSVAFRLAQAGARVTLLEACEPASGTSGTSFAWMNANNKAPLAYHRLNSAGMTEHMALREELGIVPWLHTHGNIMWEGFAGTGSGSGSEPVGGGSLDAKLDRLREWNYPVEILTPADLSVSHPELAPPDDVDRIASFPTEGYVDVPQLVACLVQAARRHGACVLTRQNVVGIEQEACRVTGVRTASGEHVAADVVVTCTGRWTDKVTALIGHPIPMAPTLGLLVTSSPIATTLRSLVHTPRVNIRPDGGSRILIASHDLDARLTSDISREQLEAHAHELLERARKILPALGGGTVESIRVGVRSIPRDGFPVIGPVPGLDGFYAIATHSGVTMGPLLGRIATREILGGEVDDRVLDYRPDRFVDFPASAT